MNRLFEQPRKERWRGSRALVPMAKDACPDCGAALNVSSSGQLPLLRHGGYGEVRTSVTCSCPCGWALHVATVAENPRGVS